MALTGGTGGTGGTRGTKETVWTTSADIQEQIERLWSQGRILSARVQAEALFPYAVRLSKPTAAALGNRFDEVRKWIRALEEGSVGRYQIEWAEINHRQLGRNRVPSGVWIPTEEAALRLLEKRRQADRFSTLAEPTLRDFPSLRTWIAGNPLMLLEHAVDWDRILAVLRWFRDNPRSGLYLRQLDIPLVDTKFIERRRALFMELLDCILPADCIDPTAISARTFERRYGLQYKPPLVRLRILDESKRLGGLSDIATPAMHLGRWTPDVKRVFITENEINGLAFPAVPDSVVIFGLGYSLERLAEVDWLHAKQIYYWGDIDTHGFAILDHLRGGFPTARSFLMDRETLLAHRELWGQESERNDVPLLRLTDEEKRLYEDLRGDLLGHRLRLEQERIAFGRVQSALARIVAEESNGGF